MNQSFKIKTGSDQEVKAIQNDYQEAQKWCNFTLLQPKWFPTDIKNIEQSLRSEQASHSSSHRIVAKGMERSLSIKQFLFDFAPPAYDHPNLWRNPKITEIGEFPKPRAYQIRDSIFWIGHDHRKMPSAAIGLHRVRVEITVLNGKFSDQELLKIFKNLTPADTDYAQHLQDIPFALLSYQHRYPKNATNVPLSYWNYQRDKVNKHLARLVSDPEIQGVELPPPSLSQLGYMLDSVFLITEEDGTVNEVDFIYEAKQKNGAYLRLLISPPNSKKPIPYPAEIYTQECQMTLLTVGSQKIYQAWHTDDFGAFEASFQYKGNNALLLAQSAGWTSQAWFRHLLELTAKG